MSKKQSTQKEDAKKSVLVIDDETEILRLLKRRIEASHYRCLTAVNPVEGLQKAVRAKPNLILLDLMLPRMSGFGFLRELKNHPQLKATPVIVLTALGDEEIAREAISLGAIGYLTKACDSEILMNMVHQYIGENLAKEF